MQNKPYLKIYHYRICYYYIYALYGNILVLDLQNGHSVLDTAAIKGKLEVVEFLLDRKAKNYIYSKQNDVSI